MPTGANPGAARVPAAYTFGHGLHPGVDKASSEGDLRAAYWWLANHCPTTNDARNADIAAFWQAAGSGSVGQAITELTGASNGVQPDVACRVHLQKGCRDLVAQ